jgi:hypothetical protein
MSEAQSHLKRYRISKNGAMIGRFDRQQIAQMLSDKTLWWTDFYHEEGMTEWKPLSEMAVILKIVSQKHPNVTVAGMGPPRPGLANVVLTEKKPVPEECPDCGSKRIRAASAIYASGTRNSSYSGTSARGYSYGRSGSSSTFLAQECSPPIRPEKPRAHRYVIAALVVVAIFSQMLIFAFLASHAAEILLALVPFAVAAFFLIRHLVLKSRSGDAGFVEQMLEYEANMDVYRRTWYCSKCSSVFLHR